MAEKPKLNKRSSLGKGLSALLQDNEVVNKGASENAQQDSVASSSVNEIDIESIEVNPYQPRTDFDAEALQELANSIKVHGIIQPITVRKLDADTYQLISGERRLQASKLAGLTQIPAYVRTADDQQMMEMALIENIQRQDLNAVEIALSYQRLVSECGLRQEDLAERVGKNRSTVTNYLRLLKLPPDIQVAIRDGKLSMGHARALINVSDLVLQLDLYKRCVKDDLSVRKLEELVRTSLEEKESKKSSKSTLPAVYQQQIKKVQSDFSSKFGTKVTIKSEKENQGEIKIPFDSLDELNRLIDLVRSIQD